MHVVLQFQPKKKNRNEAARHHRLYAVWYFNFNLREKMGMSRKTPPALCRVVLQFQPKRKNGMSRKTPPALCRVVLQFQPKKRNGNESQDTTGFMPYDTSISA